MLERLGITHGQTDSEVFDLACANPVKMLFRQGYAPQTVLLWIVYFCGLMNLFLLVYWLAEALHLDRIDRGPGGLGHHTLSAGRRRVG